MSIASTVFVIRLVIVQLLYSFSETSPSSIRQRGRKRPKVHERPVSSVPEKPVPVTAVPQPTETGAMDNISPAAMSFEAKIALALQGSNWQALQHQTSSTETNNASTIPQAEALAEESVAAEPIAGVAGIPSILPDMTAKQKKKKERFDQKIARDTGDVLQLIEADTIAPVAEGVTWDQDPELVCSYNWQDSTDQNTIFVPGAPGKWAPRTIPHTLDPDTGFQYSDYNYVRQPRTPYGPMFAAMSTMNPNYNFMSTDVICDRNNLRVLLEFVQGKANGPFRLDLYTIFDTLVIVRNESRWWRHHNAEGYGSNFEKFFTTPAEGMEDATSHYRAIRYPLGPLNVVCRFEADAYDDGAASDFLTESEREAVVSGGVAQRPTFRYNLPIRVLQKGHIVPTAQMVELKTQRARDEFTPVTCQDQLWFGRTSLLYTGSYVPDTGVVNRIRNEDATKRIKAWENNNQESLRKLAALLQMLTAAMKRHKRPNRAVVLVREGKAGPLTLRSMESTNQAIGRDAFQRYWRRDPAPQQFGQRGGGGYTPGGRGQHTPGQGYRGQHGHAQRGQYHLTPSQVGQSYQNSAPRGRGYGNGMRGGGQHHNAYTPNRGGRSGHGRGGNNEQAFRNHGTDQDMQANS
ncbi:hypothetical protein HBI16_232460 [Parastagonospora nodorum]|nr:hypothetical protein HBI16_232460 [Parastagonospora nodorum]KAH6030856.1 hypothetical protein HBI54_219230 [Parastagonospora nodorum]